MAARGDARSCLLSGRKRGPARGGCAAGKRRPSLARHQAEKGNGVRVPLMASQRKREIIVAADLEALAKAAAERLLSRIAQSSGAIAICLTGGSGPEPLYALLAGGAYRSRVPWQRGHWFIGDDRFVPLPPPY